LSPNFKDELQVNHGVFEKIPHSFFGGEFKVTEGQCDYFRQRIVAIRRHIILENVSGHRCPDGLFFRVQEKIILLVDSVDKS
jgi:hypothetical protein